MRILIVCVISCFEFCNQTKTNMKISRFQLFISLTILFLLSSCVRNKTSTSFRYSAKPYHEYEVKESKQDLTLDETNFRKETVNDSGDFECLDKGNTPEVNHEEKPLKVKEITLPRTRKERKDLRKYLKRKVKNQLKSPTEAPEETNVIAVSSAILGVASFVSLFGLFVPYLGLLLFLSPLALVLGIIGYRKRLDYDERSNGKALATVGILFGAIGVGILLLLLVGIILFLAALAAGLG